MAQKPTADMPKAYDPQAVEAALYQMWMDKGFFKPRPNPGREPFCIIMPPPNVTGELHLGHALTATVEDTLIRWHRMLGDPTLWLPGVDHAGIATQNVVEKQIAKEGQSRFDLGREQFVERVWKWVGQIRTRIVLQHMRLGVSCDWSREVFTMDDGPQCAVRETFTRLFNDGLIYKGERIINWCPRCMTAISDLEVEHEETQGHLWYVRYPLLDEGGHPTEEYVTVATTRPETIVGDVAVAVNPDDPRWKSIIGREALLPIIERHIPIVTDEAVEAEFGTGAVKVTPGHDPTDFEIGARHGLPIIIAMNPDATMNAEAGPYNGLDRFETRELIVKDLERLGLLDHVEDHTLSVGHCERCDTIVEPLASKQWFVNTKPLAEKAIAAVRDGRIQMIPRRFKDEYMRWMENIRDWCISRQLWWGHRIPVWYCDNGDAFAAVDDPTTCPKCASAKLEQDPDVLDTWFSSGLWPFSTLGWPEETPDLKYWYPTSVLETGYDILFFWVARMIMLGLYDMGDVPFRHVYLHGLIRDAQGRKMTKSRGNVVDPLSLTEKYGTDAVRYTLATSGTPGNDFRLFDEKLEAARNFANKIWNASRFVIQSMKGERVTLPSDDILRSVAARKDWPLEDRWIVSRTLATAAEVNKLLTDFQLNEAGRVLYDFLWSEYCDWYLEMSKVRLKDGDKSPLSVLAYVLQSSLRLLHPIMPFVTEIVWQHLRDHVDGLEEALIIADYPLGEGEPDTEAEMNIGVVIDVVRGIREVRFVEKIPQSQPLAVRIAANTSRQHDLNRDAASAREQLVGAKSKQEAEELEILVRTSEHFARQPDVVRQLLEKQSDAISRMCRVQLTIVEDVEPVDEDTEFEYSLAEVTLVVKLPPRGDTSAESALRAKRMAEGEAEVRRLRNSLSNTEFLAKAPPEVVKRTEERLAAAQSALLELRKRRRSRPN
jgi:valyl-tRNA synthetase